MKKTYVLFYAVMLVLPMLFSCSDNDEDSGKSEISAVKKRIVKQDFSAVGEEIFYFEYDSQNRLISYSEHKKPYNQNDSAYSEVWLDKLEYGADGKLVKQVTKSKWNLPTDMNYIDYTYKNDTVFATKHIINENQNDVLKDTLLLNNKGFLVKELSNYGGYTTYSYDANNNLIKYERFKLNGVSREVVSYTYDNLINAFSNQNVPAWFWAYYGDDRESAVGANNAIIYMNETESEAGELKERSFIPDEDGYPVSFRILNDTIKNINTYELVP